MKIGLLGYSPLNFVIDIANQLVLQGHEVVVFSFTRNRVLDDIKIDFDVIYIDSFGKSFIWKIIHFVLGMFYFNVKLFSLDYKHDIFSFKDFYQYLYNFKYNKELASLDCCNFQSITMSNIWRLYLKSDCRIISSFWGSDLNLKESDVKKKNKSRIIECSEVITLQSNELEKVFMDKYRHLSKPLKVEKLLFPVRNKFFKLAEATKKEESDYTRIALGYNGTPNQNHIRCVEALDAISPELKKTILIKLYFHYGGTDAYYKEVIHRLENSGIKFFIFYERLPLQSLVQEKMNTDIFLMVPTNDGFSASVSEALYTGGIVVAGDWLPYSRYKINQLNIQWLDTFENLPGLIHDILVKKETLLLASKSNRKKVLETLDYEGNLNQWVNILSNPLYNLNSSE